MTRAERAIKALRAPDASLSRVANTVRQSLAEVIEETEARALKAEAALREIAAMLENGGSYGAAKRARDIARAALDKQEGK
jgi:uncharacterized protein with ATP-grasp and redox domains